MALCRAYTPGAGQRREGRAGRDAGVGALLLADARGEPLPVRQDERAERRGDQQGADDLEREHVLAEDDVRDARGLLSRRLAAQPVRLP